MHSPEHSGVYVNGDFSEPMSAQHNFANQYDLDNPHRAMSSYARVMLQHTKNQLALATNSARRRSAGNGTVPTLSPDNSSISSIGSTHS